MKISTKCNYMYIVHYSTFHENVRMIAAPPVVISRGWCPNCFASNIQLKTRIFRIEHYVYVFNDIKKKNTNYCTQ